MKTKIKVAINGFGTIGKRIADAVSLQNDMEIIGIAKIHIDYQAQLAISKGYKVYLSNPEKKGKSEEIGIEVSGYLEEMLEEADIVVDCTPDGVGEKNKHLYEKAGIKVIWQGGEEHEIAGFSFNAFANYEAAIGRNYTRVVSCNTTGLTRVLYLLDKAFCIDKARITLIRRAVDPSDIKKGPINAIVPEIEMPSHHGPDVQTILPHVNIATVAVKVPTTLMHVHAINIKFSKDSTPKDIIDELSQSSRIRLLNSKLGIKSTAQIFELGRDIGRPRNDMWENNIWMDSISMYNDEAYFFQAIHQECITVPENIDAIRAMTEIETNGKKSIEKTNKSLGMAT
jgi:glyceraldehyde-3-phosphate dehydrogenase (NAD(P))